MEYFFFYKFQSRDQSKSSQTGTHLKPSCHHKPTIPHWLILCQNFTVQTSLNLVINVYISLASCNRWNGSWHNHFCWIDKIELPQLLQKSNNQLWQLQFPKHTITKRRKNGAIQSNTHIPKYSSKVRLSKLLLQFIRTKAQRQCAIHKIHSKPSLFLRSLTIYLLALVAA